MSNPKLDSFIHLIYILQEIDQLMLLASFGKEFFMQHHDTAIMDIEDSMDAILDQVAETGIPVTVRRKGKTITISCAVNGSKLDRLEEHPGFLQVDPEDVVHTDWSGKWNPTI